MDGFENHLRTFGNYEKYFFGDELHGGEEREDFKGKFDVSYLCN